MLELRPRTVSPKVAGRPPPRAHAESGASVRNLPPKPHAPGVRKAPRRTVSRPAHISAVAGRRPFLTVRQGGQAVAVTAPDVTGHARLGTSAATFVPIAQERAVPAGSASTRRSGSTIARLPFGRAGELRPGIGELLLVASAEVRLVGSPSAGVGPDVCDPYTTMAPGTSWSAGSVKDDLRSSPSSSTWHSCFAYASDTVAITGQPVAYPGDAYAPGRIG